MRAWIGIDPGPSTGIVVLIWNGESWRVLAFQCNADAVDELLWWLLEKFSPESVALEKFDSTGNKAGGKTQGADVTRMLVTLVKVRCAEARVPVIERRATDVKPWATDKRLDRIRFPMGPKFRDARDACRHALRAAVAQDRTLDPLLLKGIPSVDLSEDPVTGG